LTTTGTHGVMHRTSVPPPLARRRSHIPQGWSCCAARRSPGSTRRTRRGCRMPLSRRCCGRAPTGSCLGRRSADPVRHSDRRRGQPRCRDSSTTGHRRGSRVVRPPVPSATRFASVARPDVSGSVGPSSIRSSA
jgi:hypothetical protein